MSAWTANVDRAARFVHFVHGTRGLVAATIAMMFLTIVEPVLAEGWMRGIFAFPVFVLATIGVLTLPREGVAIQLRMHRLVNDEQAGKILMRHLVYPLILVVLLMPQSFLAAYGVPHFSPLTGLVLTSFQRRAAAVFLFGLLLIPVLHMRRTRRYAPDVEGLRPSQMKEDDPVHRRRDILVVLTIAVAAIWAVILWPFWQPFSLLAWPPSLNSFGTGIRGVAALAYSLFLPVLLFTHLSAHAQAIRHLIVHAEWRTHWHRFAALWLHVALGLIAVGLHVYNLLWIVRYQSAVGF